MNKRPPSKTNSASAKVSLVGSVVRIPAFGLPTQAAGAKESEHTGTTGVIEALHNDQALVRIGNLRTRISLSKLQILTSAREVPMPKVHVVSIAKNSSNLEETIDLHGVRAAEALDMVRHAIDKALLNGLHRLTIIHGIGEGKLLQALESFLPTCDEVKSFSRDTANPGVTHIYL